MITPRAFIRKFEGRRVYILLCPKNGIGLTAKTLGWGFLKNDSSGESFYYQYSGNKKLTFYAEAPFTTDKSRVTTMTLNYIGISPEGIKKFMKTHKISETHEFFTFIKSFRYDTNTENLIQFNLKENDFNI